MSNDSMFSEELPRYERGKSKVKASQFDILARIGAGAFGQVSN